MLHRLLSRDPWFAPKRFGYGAGLPIAWQGWLVYALFLLAFMGTWLRPVDHIPSRTVGTIVLLAILIVLTARHTKGGWRWRP